MRRVMVVVAALFLFGLAGTAQAQVVQLTATLTGNQEAPAILTGAFGNATVTVDLSSQTVRLEIDVFNMPSGVTLGHFHVGPPGLAGPIVVNIAPPTNISNDFHLSGQAGPNALQVRAEQGIRSWDDFIQSLLGGQTYLNIHSAVNGGGEIRGQVIRVP